MKERLQELLNKKKELQERYKELLEKRDSFEYDPDDFINEYDNYLDETYGVIKIGDYVYNASYVLNSVDPIAYRNGLLEFVDEIPLEDSDEYNGIISEIEEIEYELEDLENEIEELNEE